MTIALSPETTRLIEQHLAAGPYRSADELLQAALTSFDQPGDVDDLELNEEDQKALDEGLAQIERGEGIPWEEVRESLRQKFFPKA